MKAVIALLLSLLTLPIMARAVVWYTDADQVSSWARDAVESVTSAEIFRGDDNGNFRPQDSVNRAELLTLIARTKGVDFSASTGTSTSQSFSDVPAGAWFAPAVAYAADAGWVTGYPDGTYRPANAITWAEFVALFQRAFALPIEVPVYSDVPTGVWYADGAGAFQQLNLTRTLHGEFGPTKEVTREEVAYAIARMLAQPSLLSEKPEQDTTVDLYRVAYRPRTDLTVTGYDIEKEALYLDDITEGDPLPVVINYTDDWQLIGQAQVRNGMQSDGEIDSIDIRLALEETNSGPVENFQLQITDDTTGEILTKDFDRSGRVFLTKLGGKMAPGAVQRYRFAVKVQSDRSFLPVNTLGVLYITNLTGFMHKTRIANYLPAPVVMNGHTIGKIAFQGAVPRDTIPE